MKPTKPIKDMTKEELEMLEKEINNTKKEIEQRDNQLKEEKYNRRIEDNKEKLQFYRDNSEFLLSLFKHRYDDCSDEYPKNSGLDRHGLPECNKCKLMEILESDWENDYEVDIELRLSKINK